MNGLIEWMARNGVSANLLMALMVFAGVASILTITIKVFPEFNLDRIEVKVEYQGATPLEIEQSIVRRIEEQLEGVEGIQDLTSIAAENAGTVFIELARGVNMAQKLDEIKAEVDRITTFPDGAEKPMVKELTNRQRVIEIIVTGVVPERTLKELAYRIKDDLTVKENISFIQVRGARDYEVSVEASNDALRAYGLSLLELANIVRRESLDLPGGEIEALQEEVVLRTLGRNYDRLDFEDIVVLSGKNGGQVHLRDLATVNDGFRDEDLLLSFNGKPAVFVEVFRIADEQVLDVESTTKTYLRDELGPTLPDGVEAIIWRNDADDLKDRLGLMLRNAGIGLTLVVIFLSLFLDLRLAFWTSVGIVVAFIGTFAVMTIIDVSLNQITMFGFILAIGIVVDDAIVTGENIFATNQKGLPPLDASITGAQRISGPVIFAVATTIAAFIPLLTAPGLLGKMLGNIPIIVISVLTLSLVEALLIMPRHLSYVDARHGFGHGPIFDAIQGIQAAATNTMKLFTDGPLDRALRFATSHPWVLLSGGIGLIIVTVGLVVGGYVKVLFFPTVEGKYVTASFELKPGAPFDNTADVANHLGWVGRQVGTELQSRLGEDSEPLVQSVYTIVGAQDLRGPPIGSPTQVPQANKGSVVLELLDPELRPFGAAVFEDRWRRAVGSLPQVRRLFFSSDFISFGAPVSVEVSAATDEELTLIVMEIEKNLSKIAGVYDVRNDRAEGKREIEIRLKPQARTYGVTLESLALQVRAAFFGIESLRVQRGREDVRVYVRLPEEERSSLSGLNDYRIRTGSGNFIPIGEVADLSEGMSPSSVQRRHGRRIVTITAAVDSAVITGQEVNNLLNNQILPMLKREVPSMLFDFGGEQREQNRAAPALARNFLLALFAIYAILAIAFRSYAQPLIIMISIPFGMIGAVFGHLIMGFDITLPSLFGIIGLSGVIVNGALVMLNFINEERMSGASPRNAIIKGAKGRFRPIFLTASTTFLGVLPLILEQSMQAQFIIPVAISIGFGVLFGTAILMLVVPALAQIQADTMVYLQTIDVKRLIRT